MASSIQIYVVTITNGNSNSTPKDGFIDHKGVQNYGVSLAATGSLSANLLKAKRRGNLRYREIINQLGMVANCYIMPETIVSDATSVLEATSFVFRMWAERGAGSMSTADESNPGATLTGTAAVKRCVARALIADLFQKVDIYDPTSADSVPDGTSSVPRFGVRIDPASGYEIGAYATSISQAEALITVTTQF